MIPTTEIQKKITIRFICFVSLCHSMSERASCMIRDGVEHKSIVVMLLVFVPVVSNLVGRSNVVLHRSIVIGQSNTS